jgi:outer membrane protein TolC
MKTFISLTMICLCAPGFAQTAPEHSPGPNVPALRVTPSLLNELAEEMRVKNPALLAASARTNAAGAGISAIPTWADPTVRAGGMAARDDFRASDGDLIYGVEQKLPLFGKPNLARRVAQAELGAQTANGEYQFQILKRELARALFQTALADQTIALGSEDLASLQTLSQAIERKYAAGQATLVELSLVENDRAKRATQLETDRDQLIHERVSLNRFLNRDLHSHWPLLELPALAGPIIYNERLINFALNNEPKINVLRQEITQAQATADLTRRMRLPDVSVGLEGRNYSGNGSFRQGALIFSMNLPWLNSGRYRSEIKRDEAKLRAAEFDLADYELSVRSDVHHLTVRIDAARRQALLYRDEIIPRSETALASASIGWEANRNSFRDLLDARRMLLDGRLMHARAVAEQYELLSELVLCCGLGNLEALQMLDVLPPETKSK